MECGLGWTPQEGSTRGQWAVCPPGPQREDLRVEEALRGDPHGPHSPPGCGSGLNSSEFYTLKILVV